MSLILCTTPVCDLTPEATISQLADLTSRGFHAAPRSVSFVTKAVSEEPVPETVDTEKLVGELKEKVRYGVL